MHKLPKLLHHLLLVLGYQLTLEADQLSQLSVPSIILENIRYSLLKTGVTCIIDISLFCLLAIL